MTDKMEVACRAGGYFRRAEHKLAAIWAEGNACLCRVQAQLANGNFIYCQVEGAKDRHAEGLLDRWQLGMWILLLWEA